MTLYRYRAVPIAAAASAAGSSRAATAGELAGESASEVRAALRRLGLQVVELRETRRLSIRIGGESLARYLRRRRLPLRAELYDSLATMLESGAPLVSALDSVIRGQVARRSSMRALALELREAVRSGSSFSRAMAAHPAWFAGDEVAIAEAGEHAGALARSLSSLASRSERTAELRSKVAGALAYPAIVATVGLGAFLFLANRTLPQLAKILVDAKVEVPALTRRVIAIGQHLISWGFAWIAAAAVLAGFLVAWKREGARRGQELPVWLSRLRPTLPGRIAIAAFAKGMAELLRSGVPAVDALRVLAPTVASASLRRRITQAAASVERGEELSEALSGDAGFDPELQRLLEVGEASGELESLLDRFGDRAERGARRRIERLATLLEPAALLTLAALIGLVALAAVLPLVRMQEILR